MSEINKKYYKIKYPFMKYILNFNKLKILNKIKNFNPIIHNTIPNKFINYNFKQIFEKYILIEDDWITNLYINSLTDYFTEPIRITCSFAHNIPIIDYWNKNKNILITNTKKKYGIVNILYLREMLYNDKNVKICNNFRITISLAILNIFKPKKWLDISAGWGDRLISAILYGVDLYYATDPNINLHPYYQQIINTLVDKPNRKNFIIKNSGFENLDIMYDYFDIVFSSPPFFDLEIYSTFENDSLVKYNSADLWSEQFLKPTLVKSYNHLKLNGHLILYINTPDYVLKQFKKLDNIMQYQGVIYFYDKSDLKPKFRKIYVWKKIIDNQINDLV
jgi:hypothetical protein